MNQQVCARLEGERRAKLTLIRLLCAVSIWRTAMTRVLPLGGAAAWWVTLACLLPGFLTAALMKGIMLLTRTETLPEAVRACLGKAGAGVLSLMLTVMLTAEGVSSITALITLFTEGIGTRGTQLTLAVLTGGVLLFSLHREGLSRAAHFLRWGICAAVVLMAAILLTDAKPDNLFPFYGDGRTSAISALRAGVSLAWPVVLLLTVEASSAGRGRLHSGILPAFAAVGALLLLTLLIPHELLVRQTGLAELLLLPTRYAPNALQIVALCLLLLTFFLAIGACAQLATQQLSVTWKTSPVWLPYVVLAVMLVTQVADIPTLWALLGHLEPWLLVPLAAVALCCLPIALIRRKRA